MINFFKHLFSFILPVTVLVLVPSYIEHHWQPSPPWMLIPGILVGWCGLWFMASTIAAFITQGKGTLAPWSPTQRLVVTGLYRYVRNPMILGVWLVLLAEALCFASVPLVLWAALFLVINTLYFIFSEEPGLSKRFGHDYEVYKKHVNRWWPRFTPYDPSKPHHS